MAGYQIEFSKSAVKDYSKLPEQYKTLVQLALKKLSDGSHVDVKPLKGEKDTFRIRVGRYRILYVQIGHTLLVSKIAHRREAYR